MKEEKYDAIACMYPLLNPKTPAIGFALEAAGGAVLLGLGAASYAQGSPVAGVGEFLGFFLSYSGLDNILG